jgi:hypothetical protein
MKRDIDGLITQIAPDPGPGPTAGARELFDEITATDAKAAVPETAPHAARRIRRRFAPPLVAVLAAAAVAVSWLLPGGLGVGPRPASALDIRQEGGYYVVTVKQLFADPQRYEAELRSRGLDISLTVEPVSPGMEGMVAPPFDQRYNGLSFEQIARRKDLISSIQRPGACAASFRCTIGLKVPVGYKGKAHIMLGRKGRPGERFHAFGMLNNPGEPLQCVTYVNKTVAEVRPMLAAGHVTIATFAVPLKGSRTWVPGDWYVHEGWLTQPGKALLVAAPTRNLTPSPMRESCPKGS